MNKNMNLKAFEMPDDILTDDAFDYPEGAKPVAAPLFQTSLFTFPDVESLEKAINDETEHYLYSRGNNPTVKLVEAKIAALEGGEQAKLLSSGAAAIASAILSSVRQGDHIVCSNEAYSWARYISSSYLERFGVTVSFVDASDTAAVEQAINKRTKVLYLESPSSLFLRIQDLRTLSKLAQSYGITTIVDNTWATPLYQNPLKMGIDLVVHSASKYLGGHSDLVGGVVVGSAEKISHLFKSEYLPIGQVPDPFQAWLIQRGMRTLHLRVAHHYQAALKVCDYLYNHSKVLEINYPMHHESPWFDLASKQMSGGSGLLSIRLKATDREKIQKAVNGLSRFRIGVSWGGYESLVFPMLVSKGGDPSMLRLHIGLESVESLINDLDKMLYGI